MRQRMTIALALACVAAVSCGVLGLAGTALARPIKLLTRQGRDRQAPASGRGRHPGGNRSPAAALSAERHAAGRVVGFADDGPRPDGTAPCERPNSSLIRCAYSATSVRPGQRSYQPLITRASPDACAEPVRMRVPDSRLAGLDQSALNGSRIAVAVPHGPGGLVDACRQHGHVDACLCAHVGSVERLVSCARDPD